MSLCNCGGAGGGFAVFYGLTAGTGNPTTSDYAAPIAAGAPVPYPRLGPTGGPGPATALTDTSFNLPLVGTYEIDFDLCTTEPGQLQLRLDGVLLFETTTGDPNPTLGGHPIRKKVVIVTTVVDSVLEVVNPPGNATALTVTPADGAFTHAYAQTLTIKQIN